MDMVGREKLQNLPPMKTSLSVLLYEEIQKYLKAKKTQRWRYEKLSGPEASEHRQKENERVSQFYYKKKAAIGKDGTDDKQDDDERAKELGRIR